MNISDISALRESASSLALKHSKNSDRVTQIQDEQLRPQAENATFVVSIDAINMAIRALENGK